MVILWFTRRRTWTASKASHLLAAEFAKWYTTSMMIYHRITIPLIKLLQKILSRDNLSLQPIEWIAKRRFKHFWVRLAKKLLIKAKTQTKIEIITIMIVHEFTIFPLFLNRKPREIYSLKSCSSTSRLTHWLQKVRAGANMDASSAKHFFWKIYFNTKPENICP